MSKKGTSILKRQRELKKAERALLKRERREEQEHKKGTPVASEEDLRGYGLPEDRPTRNQPA